jgi:hypothetical protein
MAKSPPKRRGQDSKPAGFFGTLQKSKKDAAKRWNEAKKAKDQFKTPDIPAGVYMARLSNITQGETSNNKVPYIAFQFTVIRHPEWKGTPLSILHTVEEKRKKPSGKEKVGEVWLTEQEALDNIAIDLQRLGIETEELDGNELDAAIADLVSEKPVIQVKVKRTKGSDGADYVNTRILKLMDEEGEEEDDDDVEDDDGEEAPEEEDVEDEEADVTDDDDEEVEADDDDEDVEEEDEEDGDTDPPEVDDLVKWKAPKARKMAEFTVTAVNVAKEIVTLKRNSDDKVFPKVPWSELEYEYDE